MSKKSKGKSGKSKKKHGQKKKKASSKLKRKKKVRKKPKGPSVGPKPPGPSGPWKPPKKKKKKWPPKKKKKKKKKKTPVSSLLQASDFAPHVGTFFDITDFSPVMKIELVEVTSFGTQQIPDGVEGEIRTEPFSLQFEGPVGIPIAQNAYTLSHTVLGTLLMLLVPIGDTNGGRAILEAIYN